MQIFYYQVHQALTSFVESIFLFDKEADGFGEFMQISLPTPDCYISFEYETDFVVKSYKSKSFQPAHITTIIPPQLGITHIKGNNMKSIMVKFKHNGFYRLFKTPLPVFENDCYNARQIFNKEFGDVYEKVISAKDVVSKVNEVQQFLIKKSEDAKPYHLLNHAVDNFITHKGNLSIHDLASTACMSVRQLQRKFTDEFGIRPKLYGKLLRFNSANEMKKRLPHLSWGQIASRCGFYDQMHLIRDFKTIAHLNPIEMQDNFAKEKIMNMSAHTSKR